MAPILYPLAIVAKRTHRSETWLRRLCTDGRIPCHRVAGDWYIAEPVIAIVDAMEKRNRRGS